MKTACALPATIPGLLRRGSPVLAVWDEESIEDGEFSASGVVLRIYATEKDLPAADCGWDSQDPDQSCAADTLHLDLTDATGRAHAAWWLASQIWRARDHRWRQPIGWFAGVAAWYLVTSGDDPGWASPDRKRGMSVGMEPRTIESLRGLDMADARLLPDGSRWVDAEALRRVCLHVAKENP